MKPHKWAKEIHAWADGAQIQWRTRGRDWEDTQNPHFEPSFDFEYRIKPEPKTPGQLLFSVWEEIHGHKWDDTSVRVKTQYEEVAKAFLKAFNENK